MVVLNTKGEGEVNIALKNKRKERGLTQAQLAEAVGITVTGYQRYESGERIPNAPTAIQIADVLNIKSYKQFKALFGAATPDTTKEPDGNPAQ